MGSPRAKASVVLADPETGSPRVFEAGDQLPGWALALITNPDVADQDHHDDPAVEVKPKPRRTRRTPAK